MNKTIYIDALQYPKPTRIYFEEAQQAGLDMVHVTVVFWENIHETITFIGDWFRFIEQNSDLLYSACSLEGLEMKQDGRVGILFGFQNCSSIENNIDMLQIYRRLNVGVMQLSYNNLSHLCCGCYEMEDTGLSRFGRAAIAEMNRVGMVIDMSHSSERSTYEAIEHSSRPISITHAHSLTFKKAVRNKSDDLIKKLVESGGMFGLSFYPFHLKNTSDCTMDELMDELKRLGDMVGLENIGIGSDICQGRPIEALEYMRNGHWTREADYGEDVNKQNVWPKQPSWFRRVSDFAQLAPAMRLSGFCDADIAKVLGENWLRYFSKALRPSGE